jgi:hypothetical protein
MNAATDQRRGSCPGLWNPMRSGDGLIVRVPTSARALRSVELRTLARLAKAHGNGLLELTRRSNLQLRGVTTESLPQLQAALVEAGIAAPEPMLPLWVDPYCGLLGRCASLEPLARELATLAMPSGLPAKFGVVLHAGGPAGVAADIRLDVDHAQPGLVQLRAACDAAGNGLPLGVFAVAQASGVVLQLMAAMVELLTGEAQASARAVRERREQGPNPSSAADVTMPAGVEGREPTASAGSVPDNEPQASWKSNRSERAVRSAGEHRERGAGTPPSVVLSPARAELWKLLAADGGERLRMCLGASAKRLPNPLSDTMTRGAPTRLDVLGPPIAGSWATDRSQEPGVSSRLDSLVPGGAESRSHTNAERTEAREFSPRLAQFAVPTSDSLAVIETRHSRAPEFSPIGFHIDQNTWFGLGVPFGSAPAAAWIELADLAEHFGDGTLRFTPDRAVLLPHVTEPAALQLRAAAVHAGFIVDSADPLLRVIACSGAPHCDAALGETRQLARSLAPHLEETTRLHVSGCSKGCAERGASDITLVLAADGCRLGRGMDPATTSVQGEVLSIVQALATLNPRAHPQPSAARTATPPRNPEATLEP